ncbi:MAG TPA: hypothetical protein VGB72_06105 [Acidobacteriota bacterium]
MEHNGENLEKIRQSIRQEKNAARPQLEAAGFRAKLKSRLALESMPRLPRQTPGLWAFFKSRPLGAAASAAGLLALGTALWFLVLAPSLRRPTGTLEEHILRVLHQSSLAEQAVAEPLLSPGVLNTPFPDRVPDQEIPLILYKALKKLRPASAFPDIEEEPDAPAGNSHDSELKEKNRFFYEILKHIKEV